MLGGGANQIQQDLVTSSIGLQRFTRNGTQYSLTGNLDYDANSRPSNLFPSVYETRLEAQVRHPLLQGRGRQFNSISGPNARVDGQGSPGILIAKANTDLSFVQFERDLTTFVDELITAYWNLLFAYRDVEIARSTLQRAEETWKVAESRNHSGMEGGEAYREALAREQRDRLEVQYLDAIFSTGENSQPGLIQAEARLRLLIKIPANQNVLFYPSEPLLEAPIVFDLASLKNSAERKRGEVRQQKIRVQRDKQRLIAARNFLLPRLDVVGTYRNNGFGDTLAGGSSRDLRNALSVASKGLFDEWEIGIQYNAVLGNRRAKSGVRNSQLQLRRSKKVLDEIRDRIAFDLNTALRSKSRAEVTLAAAKRLKIAAEESYESHTVAFESGFSTIDELLRSQQRLSDAQRTYYRQLIDHTLSIKSVNRESGMLLEAHGVSGQFHAY